MPGHHLTQSEYATQKTVKSLGKIFFLLEVHHLTHTYRVVFCFCELENIGYPVQRYLNTSTLPFEEFSEEWLFDVDV